MDSILSTIYLWALASQLETIQTVSKPLLGSAALLEFPLGQAFIGGFVLLRVLFPSLSIPGQSSKIALVLLSLYANRFTFQVTLVFLAWTENVVLVSGLTLGLVFLPFIVLAVSYIPPDYGVSGVAALILFYKLPGNYALLLFITAALSELPRFRFSTPSIPFISTLILVLISHLAPSPPHSFLLPIQSFPLYHPTHSNLRILNSTNSITGQIVVGEIFPGKDSPYSRPIRYLRADHSLIGGVWLDPNSLDIVQSIYPAFFVQEAVRLIDPQPDNRNVILLGLGVGTAVEGFVTHNYLCSILELDPAVYEAATTYFNLPSTINKVIIEDATVWADKYNQGSLDKRYGIVIHDFFSGGGVPSNLYTTQFWTVLNEKILSSDGILVVNFYGSYESLITKSIARTLLQVFPSCIMLHDKLGLIRVTDDEPLNMILFCRKTESNLQFRKTIPEDWGTSNLRQHIFQSLEERILSLTDIGQLPSDEYIITDEFNPLNSVQRSNSRKHWEIMNHVLPIQAWQLY